MRIGEGFRSIAIVFMHGYRHTQHEARVAALAKEVGFTQISVSHQVSPLMKLVGRGDTTVVDAYLSPILRRYVDTVAAELEGCGSFSCSRTAASPMRGASTARTRSSPGPRAESSARCARRCGGLRRIIGFDMGGTSTDVSHYAGAFEREFETLVAGVRMRAPMMSIHTVAAGGGSILHFDGARYRVGPDSAGANPGPASYRRGGPLAVTDANVMLGKIQPDIFRTSSARTATSRSTQDVVRGKFAELAKTIGDGRSPEAVAEGFLQIAVGNMANAIKHISVQRGHDVTEYTLCCFGGAAGQHACLVADALAMSACSSIRSPACSRPTAWGSPTRWRCGRRRWRRCSSPRRSTGARVPVEARLATSLCFKASRRHAFASASRASEVRRHRHGADRALSVPSRI
jgi:5-oxoprolinase (ATP-hydrolysing)